MRGGGWRGHEGTSGWAGRWWVKRLRHWAQLDHYIGKCTTSTDYRSGNAYSLYSGRAFPMNSPLATRRQPVAL